ncbi:MAG TPA: hypothetical protein VIM04_00250 [Candidatus Binatia bacterium]
MKLLQLILSCLVLVLVLGDMLLAIGNQSMQTEVSERQQFIAQAIQLDTLSRQVVGVLANLAMKTNDEPLKKLLAASGVNLDVTGGPAPASK